MPPRRKPFDTWALNCASSLSLKAQNAAGGHPVGIHGPLHADRAIAGEDSIEALDPSLLVL